MCIANGFYEDCQDLIQRCLKLELLNFQSFCNVWKEMLFTYIYQEISSYGEIGEISEEFIRIAKHFMLQDTDNLKEAKIGLYIVYALLTQQPFANFAYLRICASEVQKLKSFENAIRLQRDNDALFIFGRVLVKHTRYTAVDRERGFEASFTKYLNGSSTLQNKKKPMGIFSDQNEETDMLKELGTIAKKYKLCRDRVNKKNNIGTKYVNQDLPSQLTLSFKKLLKGNYEEDDAEIRYNTVTDIKKRAMANTANPLQHLRTSQQSTAIDKKEKDIHTACSSKSIKKAMHDDTKELCPATFVSRIKNSGQYKKITIPYENKITNSLKNDVGLKIIEDYAIEENNTDVDTNEISETKDRKRKNNKEINEVPNTDQKKSKMEGNNVIIDVDTNEKSYTKDWKLNNNKEINEVPNTYKKRSKVEENNVIIDVDTNEKSYTKDWKRKNNKKINEIPNTYQKRSKVEETNLIIDVDTNEKSYTKDWKQKNNKEINKVPITYQKKSKTINTKSREGDKETKEVSETEGETLEVEEIPNNKELNKNLPIIHQIDESECEIEIIDYATNSKIPVNKFFSAIFKSANL